MSNAPAAAAGTNPGCGNCRFWMIKAAQQAMLPPDVKECWWGPPLVVTHPQQPEQRSAIIGAPPAQPGGPMVFQILTVRPRLHKTEYCFRHELAQS